MVLAAQEMFYLAMADKGSLRMMGFIMVLYVIVGGLSSADSARMKFHYLERNVLIHKVLFGFFKGAFLGFVLVDCLFLGVFGIVGSLGYFGYLN